MMTSMTIPVACLRSDLVSDQARTACEAEASATIEKLFKVGNSRASFNTLMIIREIIGANITNNTSIIMIPACLRFRRVHDFPLESESWASQASSNEVSSATCKMKKFSTLNPILYRLYHRWTIYDNQLRRLLRRPQKIYTPRVFDFQWIQSCFKIIENKFNRNPNWISN